VEFVGSTKENANLFSDALFRLAGYPYGTYIQEEPCIRCGALLLPPPHRRLASRAFSRVAHLLSLVSLAWASPKPLWMHALYVRR
jgi:hypothetical protein